MANVNAESSQSDRAEDDKGKASELSAEVDAAKVDAAELVAPQVDAATQEQPANRQLQALLRRLMPWLSLCLGIASAALMNRSPERAPLVAAAAGGLWLLLTIRIVLLRPRSDANAARKEGEAGATTTPTPPSMPQAINASSNRQPGRVQRVLRVSTLIGTQSLSQFALFFAAPLYLEAADRNDIGHLAFLSVVACIACIALWDPWTELLLSHPLTSAIVPTAASFLGLSAVLPGLGLSNPQSLWLAAGAAAFGTLLASIVWSGQSRWQRLGAVSACLLAPVFLLLGGARLMPAAPMRLMDATFGTAREGYWVADPTTQLSEIPRALICATAIYAPQGIHESLWHVWRHNGVEQQRLDLKIVGGRRGGFRTRTYKRKLGRYAQGRWTCSVETGSGQWLGQAHLQIGGRAAR